MQAALTFGETRQRTSLVPKQVIGLTAVLLTGATITPINMQAAHKITSFGISTQAQSTNIDLSPQNTLNLKLMEQTGEAEVLPPVNVGTIILIDKKQEIEMLREKIVSSVLSWQGIKYKWGGRTKAGVDCSGLVQRIYSEHGLQLPRTSYEQFREGVGIPKAKLEPGDLVFFNTDGSGVSHVGIYVGDGDFISATKDCVEVHSLNEQYWDKTYRGSRRVLV